MRFDPVINLGTMIELLIFVLAVLGAMRKVGIIEAKLNIMYSWFTTTVINQHPHQQHRIEADETEKFFGK